MSSDKIEAKSQGRRCLLFLPPVHLNPFDRGRATRYGVAFLLKA